MSEQEEKVLNLCREWYRTAKNITMQTLWYEIGVMLENEPAVEQSRAVDVLTQPACGCNSKTGMMCVKHANEWIANH